MQTSELGSVLVKKRRPAYLSFGFSLIATVVVIVVGPRMQCSLVWAPFSFRTSLSKSNFLGPSNPLYESYFIHTSRHIHRSSKVTFWQRVVGVYLPRYPVCLPALLPSILPAFHGPASCPSSLVHKSQHCITPRILLGRMLLLLLHTHHHHHYHHHDPVQVAGLFNSYTNR